MSFILTNILSITRFGKDQFAKAKQILSPYLPSLKTWASRACEVTALVQALFVANREYIPHEKWLLHLSRSLRWMPENWEDRLQAAISTGDLTVESLKSRQVVIANLWEEIDRYIIENYYPHLPVHMMQKTSYEKLKLLAKEGSISKDEWQMRTGSGVPGGDPFYPIFKFEDDQLIFDPQAFRTIDEDAMYDWHYEVLRAVRRDLQEG